MGTTAEYIKLAPIVREFKRRKISFKIITSGQTKVFFENLTGYTGKISPYMKFKEKGKRSSLPLFGWWTIRTFFSALFSLSKEFNGLNKDNSYFIVHGDTISSLMGSCIAKIYGLKLIHIESGLRSFNFMEPFPEEICRYIISFLADIHFCPNGWCKKNLKNAPGIKINTFNNTLIETYQFSRSAKKFPFHLGYIRKTGGKYFVMVVHRQEHVIFGKRETQKFISGILKSSDKNLKCIFIGHDTAKKFLKFVQGNPQWANRVIMVPRLPYLDFMKLLEQSEFIVTDGGSNQEEAYYMGKPCLALRKRTERIEGLKKNVVIGSEDRKIVNDFLKNYKTYRRRPVKTKQRPSEIIVDYLESH